MKSLKPNLWSCAVLKINNIRRKISTKVELKQQNLPRDLFCPHKLSVNISKSPQTNLFQRKNTQKKARMLNVIQYFNDYFMNKKTNKGQKKRFARATLLIPIDFFFQLRKFHILLQFLFCSSAKFKLTFQLVIPRNH